MFRLLTLRAGVVRSAFLNRESQGRILPRALAKILFRAHIGPWDCPPQPILAVVPSTVPLLSAQGEAACPLGGLPASVKRPGYFEVCVYGSAHTLVELFEAVFDHLEALGREPTTLVGYRRIVARFESCLGTVPLRKLRASHLDGFYGGLARGGSSPAHVRRYQASCTAVWLRECAGVGWATTSPPVRRTASPGRSRGCHASQRATPDACTTCATGTPPSCSAPVRLPSSWPSGSATEIHRRPTGGRPTPCRAADLRAAALIGEALARPEGQVSTDNHMA